MVIKRIEMCIELMKIGVEFVVVVAETVKIVWREHLNHRTALPPPPLLRQGISPSYPSQFIFGFLP
ncbi:unnamed protein product [Eruca vesicaria subsp. sativa]|uniref:Uncharacterized protein n=1 Tax=Eruca vesicaria subsp. sativa TaxID=29727 RepID=A0ABC8LAI7_ERUVS|nr:unnamed protein product [Eruca vesicaria subsp. sativa]